MKRTSLFFRLLTYLKPYKFRFIQSQVFMLIVTASGLVFPLAVRNLFDASSEKRSIEYVIVSIAILAVLFTVKEIFEYLKTRTLEYVSQNIIKDLRILMYDKLQQKTIDFFYKRKSGDIVSSLTNDMNLFQQSVSTGISFLVQTVVSMLLITVLLFYTDMILSLIVAVFLPVTALLTKHFGSRVKPISDSARKEQGYVTSVLNESISGADIIKAFVLKRHAVKIFTDGSNSLLKRTLDETKVKAGTTMAVGFMNAVQILMITGIGGYQVFTGQISAGTLIAFILYTQMISGPVSMLSGIFVEIQKSIAAVERIFEIIDYGNEKSHYGRQIRIPEITGSICFNHVYFSYNGQQSVLNGINLTIPPLKTAAFVGPSGVGKSTLFKLIPRFYEVTSGEIRIDNVNIRNMAADDLRSNIAIVPQETYLFGMSIKDNISCGKPEASFEEIVRAAKMANAHDFIMKLEYGYDTVTGERGAGLSGGQKQRIAIARAFVKNPKILLLDEATSSLDAQSESLVQEAIYKLMEGRTTLIIAHRLSTIIHADIIFVMDNGEIIASGKHEELLESCMLYRKMYQQSFGYSDKAS